MAKVKQVLNFTVTVKSKQGKAEEMDMFSDVEGEFYAHLVECSECRAEIVNSLREFAAKLEGLPILQCEAVAGRVQAGAE